MDTANYIWMDGRQVHGTRPTFMFSPMACTTEPASSRAFVPTRPQGARQYSASVSTWSGSCAPARRITWTPATPLTI